MKTLSRKNRLAFRPSICDEATTLESRVVLTATVRMIPLTPPPAAPPTNGASGLTRQQLQTAFNQQFRGATRDLRAAVNTQIAQLYSNGRPTQQQVNNFNAYVGGLVNATSFRLSSQSALLPGSQRLIQNLQNSLLSSTSTSLVSRVGALTSNSRTIASQGGLRSALNLQFDRTMSNNLTRLGDYFKTTPIARLAVDSSGQRVSLQNYIGSQIVNQYANTAGALAQSIPTVGFASLFPNTVPGGTLTTPSPAALGAFQSQFMQGLGVATAQLGNSLNLLSGASSTVFPQLQQAFYGGMSTPSTGTGTAQSNLFQQLVGFRPTDQTFNTDVNSAFKLNLQSVSNSVNTFLGMPTGQNVSLPTSQFNLTPNGGSFFNSFAGQDGSNVGFNNGFGSGFIGFGQAPSTFNSSFSTGFNSTVSNLNNTFGFMAPPLSTSTGNSGGVDFITRGN